MARSRAQYEWLLPLQQTANNERVSVHSLKADDFEKTSCLLHCPDRRRRSLGRRRLTTWERPAWATALWGKQQKQAQVHLLPHLPLTHPAASPWNPEPRKPWNPRREKSMRWRRRELSSLCNNYIQGYHATCNTCKGGDGLSTCSSHCRTCCSFPVRWACLLQERKSRRPECQHRSKPEGQ